MFSHSHDFLLRDFLTIAVGRVLCSREETDAAEGQVPCHECDHVERHSQPGTRKRQHDDAKREQQRDRAEGDDECAIAIEGEQPYRRPVCFQELACKGCPDSQERPNYRCEQGKSQ